MHSTLRCKPWGRGAKGVPHLRNGGGEGTQPHRPTKQVASTLVPKIVVSEVPPFTKLREYWHEIKPNSTFDIQSHGFWVFMHELLMVLSEGALHVTCPTKSEEYGMDYKNLCIVDSTFVLAAFIPFHSSKEIPYCR